MHRKKNRLVRIFFAVMATAAAAGLVWSMSAADEWQTKFTSSVNALGMTLDVQPLAGALMTAGVVSDTGKLKGAAGADEEILDLLGSIDRGYRMEICSLSQKGSLATVFSSLNAGGGMWGILFCKVKGQKPIEWPGHNNLADVQDYLSWGSEHGITFDKLAILGPSGSGKTTLLATVTNVDKFNAAGWGISGAARGDRVHFIPQGQHGWKLALCSVKDSVLLRINLDKSKLTR